MNLSRNCLYFSLALVGTTAAFAATPPMAATTAREGIANASVHASVAAKIDTLEGAHLHLQHAINCLEGPHGALYSAKAEALSAYHCNGIDVGAIDDPRAGRDVQKLARQAVQEASAGIGATRVGVAHQDATAVVQTLAAAEHAWPTRH